MQNTPQRPETFFPKSFMITKLTITIGFLSNFTLNDAAVQVIAIRYTTCDTGFVKLSVNVGNTQKGFR